MMYQSKLAVAIKSAGKVLREFKSDQVYLPFGSEYSIFVKNMNTVRALCTVTVDGVDIGDGTRFVVDPNDSINIERFIKNGNLAEGNRLKFIERTGRIEEHRGVGIEDGLVRVEFNFEKKIQPVVFPFGRRDSDWFRRRRWDDSVKYFYHNDNIIGSPTYGASGSSGGWSDTTTTISSTGEISNEVTFTASNSVDNGAKSFTPDVNINYAGIVPDVENDAGITVPGSISDQEFKTASWFPTETETHVIVLKMLGETHPSTPVAKAITVKTKQTCPTCGCKNKATAKFCTECGTSLQLV